MIDFQTLYYNWLPVAYLLSMIHLLLVALVYMAAKFFESKELLGYAKHELAQGLYSLFLVGMITVILTTAGVVGYLSIPEQYREQGIFLDPTMGLNFKARYYLVSMYNDIRVLAKGILKMYDWAETCASLKIKAGLSRQGIIKGAIFQYPAYVLSNSYSILVGTMLFLKMQDLFLVLNTFYFFPVLLNLGLLFRILPFSRKLGGLLMGIALGTYLVLPFMYIVAGVFLRTTDNFGTQFIFRAMPLSITCATFGHMTSTPGRTYVVDEYIDKLTSETKDTYRPSEGYLSALKDVFVYGNAERYGFSQDRFTPVSADTVFLAGTSEDYVNENYSVIEVVAREVLVTVILSVFALVGTISAIREISISLGGDVEIAGLTRLI